MKTWWEWVRSVLWARSICPPSPKALEPACRAYVEALGAPLAPALISIFLDCPAPELIRVALESLESRVAAGKAELTGGLRTQLRSLAHHADDHIAGISEDLLA